MRSQMRNLLLFIPFLFLVGCATPMSYWQHYQNCSTPEKSIREISDCGKQSRMSYINESKSNQRNRSKEGDEYMMWADLLAKQVEDGQISEEAAKMKLVERNQKLAQQQRANQLAILGAWSNTQSQNKSMTCRDTGFGTMTCD